MRALAAVVLLLTAGAAHAQYGESISVVRILVDVRVTEFRGNPISDLTPEDYEVKIGGKRAQVESVEWVDDVATGFSPSDGDARLKPGATPPVPQGRLIVVFVQTDFARNASRMHG